MPRHHVRVSITKLSAVLGVAALAGLSGCAALPAVGIASNLMHPVPPTPAGQPSPDMLYTLVQQLDAFMPATAKPAAADATTTAAK